jgi:hypothetical protein
MLHFAQVLFIHELPARGSLYQIGATIDAAWELSRSLFLTLFFLWIDRINNIFKEEVI